MSAHLRIGDVADMWHAGTNSFYTATITSEPMQPAPTLAGLTPVVPAEPPDFAKDADEFMRRYAEAFEALKRAMPTEPPQPSQAHSSERPNRSLVDSTMRWRINSTAHKVNDAFNAARIEARDECLWLSRVCSEALDDNDALRVKIEKLEKKLAEKERQDDGSK